MQRAGNSLTTTRRAVLAGAAAAPLAALPVAAAEPGSRALEAFREWRAAYDAYYAQSAITDADEPLNRLLNVVNEAERRIVALPPTAEHAAAVIVAFMVHELAGGVLGGAWYEGGAICAMAATMLPTMPAEIANFVAPMLTSARSELDEDGGVA